MKKKSKQMNKLANLTFYSPHEGEFSEISSSTIEKSQKFFRNIISKVSPSDMSPHSSTVNAYRRSTNQTYELPQNLSSLEPEAPITASTVQEGIDLSPIRIISDHTKFSAATKLHRFSDKSLEKLPSNLRFRDSTDRSLDKTRKDDSRTQEEGELSKIYKSAHAFQGLKFTKEKEDIARQKLSEDKTNTVSAQLDAVRADISHIFNRRPSRIKSPSHKLLPEVRDKHTHALSKITKEVGSGLQVSASETSFGLIEKRNHSVGHILSSSMGPVTPIKILDNNLQDSKFFGPSTSIGGQRSLLYGALQRDIHSVQSPLGKNARIQLKSQHERSLDKSDFVNTGLVAFDVSEDSPFQSLKKEIPSVFSSTPANRQELVQLGSWLNNALKGIKENKGLNEKERFCKADEIYNICFNELIRQVSVECMERGELIMVVWKAYLGLIEDIIDDVRAREEKAEERGQKECEKVHNMYNEILGIKEKLIEEQKQKMNEYDILNKELMEKIKDFDEKEAIRMGEIAKLKEALMKGKKNYMHLQQEQRDLQYKYQRLKKNFDQIEEESSPEHTIQQRQSLLSKKHDLNFSFSSGSDDDIPEGKEPFVFGAAKHKVITYAEKSVMYEPPVGLGEVEIQTDLVFVSERYNRILESQKKVDNILLEDIAKSKLVQAAEMMENLSNGIPGSRKESEAKLSKSNTRRSVGEETKRNVTPSLDHYTHIHEKHGDMSKRASIMGSEEHSRVEKAMPSLDINVPPVLDEVKEGVIDQSNSEQVEVDMLKSTLQSSGIAMQASMLSSSIATNNDVKNVGKNKTGSKTKGKTQKEKTQENKKESSQEQEAGKVETIKEEDSKKTKDKLKNSEKAKPINTKAQSTASAKETQPLASQNKPSGKKETSKVETPAKSQGKTVKTIASQKANPLVKQPTELMSPSAGDKLAEEAVEEAKEEKEVTNENQETQPEQRITEEAMTTDQGNQQQETLQEVKETENLTTQTDKVSFGEVPLITETPAADITPTNKPAEQKIELTTITDIKSDRLVSERSEPELASENTAKAAASDVNRTYLSPEKSALKGPNTSTRKPMRSVTLVESPKRQVTSPKSALSGEGAQGEEDKKLRYSQTVALGPGKTDDKNVGRFMEQQEQRIIQLMSMYKVEKQKQEDLSGANRDLESQLNKNKKVIRNLEDLVEELRKKIDLSEQNKESSPRARKNEKKTTVVDDSKKKFTHSSSIELSEQTPARHLLTFNDAVLEIPIVPPNYRGSLNLPVATSLVRKNQILDRRNQNWQIVLSKAQRATQNKSAKLLDFMQLKSLMKQITALYAEKLQSGKDIPVTREQDMATFVYKQFLHTYGFQQFAMKKFMKFMGSVKKYSGIHRVGIFARMLCIASDETNYSHNEVKQYMLGFEYLMMNSSVGVYYPNLDYEKKHFTSFIRAIEYIRIFGERRMTLEELLDIKRELEIKKVFDPTGRNPQGIVDLDEFLEKIVDKYKELIAESKEYLKPVFMAGDPYGNKGIVYVEFAMLYRIIEGHKHDEKKLEDHFTCNCDIIVNGEIALSYEKFVIVCFDLNVFSKYAQDTFLGIMNDEEIEVKFEELKGKWKQEKYNLLELIEKNKSTVPPELVKLWHNALAWVDDKIADAQDALEKTATMLKYKVLCGDLAISQ